MDREAFPVFYSFIPMLGIEAANFIFTDFVLIDREKSQMSSRYH
jgi:hypothetical protein